MSIILKAENISKQYRLGTVGTGTLRDDFKRNWAKLRGKEDPFLKVGAVNDRSQKSTEDYVWALRDINFEVKQGEVLGIIGKNGAGKSTLLKILSRVTAPTTGVIKSRGRIASLLEVGTGFHHELTGRENIYLNGAILGMTRAEINTKLDEIIHFSGCERYIDTPTKRYSSGMTVRLAFAVAAHLEPEILVVDEVLAVGDAEFQKKAIGKMQDISQGEGRTVLFVSHNMASVRSLCIRGLLLENGTSIYEGDIDSTVGHYLDKNKTKTSKSFVSPLVFSEDQIVRIKSFKILSKIQTGSEFDYEFVLESRYSNTVELAIGFVTSQNERVYQIFSGNSCEPFNLIDGEQIIRGSIKQLPLTAGSYTLNLWAGSGKIQYVFHKDALQVEVSLGSFKETKIVAHRNYALVGDAKWEYHD
ncbi:ABC transporter ATP-binding protein [Leeuwenhoekiella palythoae]|uniref:Lipopolysaccharide transport system ATP-binding protein n=1 Tax=Leeuwenhoekiella palythoae TaxID=573501 RepID=A0A1M5Z069_9FLAO|nr:polysaccharide ABC transporter ATP-binding protein [Leeuwenhoekiella palythoae]RXG29741.1 lipopolysaccharide transport system ATP-binding protein [Leeuwenhoekiella palythoae]SHI17672.1 lipopolysaccharide transport system ATP-binding protein [Leeuwenhoekiella palythoae]